MQKQTSGVAPAKLATVIVFTFFAICALLIVGYYAYDVTASLLSKQEVIEFNKGAMYLLGVGLGAGMLVVFMIHELAGKEISSTYNKKTTRLALISVGLILVLPQVTDYMVNSKVKSMRYVFCPDQSYRWLHSQNKVFSAAVNTCRGAESDKAITELREHPH